MPLFGRKRNTANKRQEGDMVSTMIEKARRASPLLKHSRPHVTARFDRDEIVLGEALSTNFAGECNAVYAVRQLPHFAPSAAGNLDQDSNIEANVPVGEVERRRVCTSGGAFVVKCLNPKLVKRQRKLGRLYDLAVASLVLEAQFLSRLQHANISRLRGLPLGGEHAASGRSQEFFFMMDRIVETLSDRIDKWKAQEHESHRLGLKLDISSPLFATKLRIANAIISALDYLQAQHGIVLLNLNPDNIGFLQNGTVQLFDLGHCREIKEEEAAKNHRANDEGDEDDDEEGGLCDDELSVDDLSVMLGSPLAVPPETPTLPAEGLTRTGGHRKVLPTAALGVVPRYLAPEIVTRGQYSLKSDSYSFALILHEMLTLSRPYASYQPGNHFIKVCVQGKRPNLHLYQFPKVIETLLYKGWKHNWNKRITVRTMNQVLSNVQVSPSSPRSTKPLPSPSTKRRGGRRPPTRKKESVVDRSNSMEKSPSRVSK